MLSYTFVAIDKHSVAQQLTEEQQSQDEDFNFKHKESVRTYQGCRIWTRLLFTDINSSLKILRHLLLPWSGCS